MMQPTILENLISRMDLVENLYDVIRLVDPLQKIVYETIPPKIDFNPSPDAGCYNAWCKPEACENCNAMRSLNHGKNSLKIEDIDGRIYMVTAVPVDHENHRLILELIKDVTEDGIIDIAGLNKEEIHKLISRKNSLLIKDALTRIYNETYIFERLPVDMLDARKSNIGLALFRIQIKNIQLSDFRKIGKLIQTLARRNGSWASRYQDDEFLLILRQVSTNQVNRLYRQIEDKFKQYPFKPQASPIDSKGFPLDLKGLPLDSMGSPVDSKGLPADVEIKIGFEILNDAILTPAQFIECASPATTPAKATTLDSSAASIAATTVATEASDTSSERVAVFLKQSLLSPREKEVALLLLKGFSNGDIGGALYLSLSTVKKHISAIFEKTQVKSRGEFIAKSLKN